MLILAKHRRHRHLFRFNINSRRVDSRNKLHPFPPLLPRAAAAAVAKGRARARLPTLPSASASQPRLVILSLRSPSGVGGRLTLQRRTSLQPLPITATLRLARLLTGTRATLGDGDTRILTTSPS